MNTALPTMSQSFTNEGFVAGPMKSNLSESSTTAPRGLPDMFRIRLHSDQSTVQYKYLVAPTFSRTPAEVIQRSWSLAFDKVPSGDWVVGQLSADDNGHFHFMSPVSMTATADKLEALGLRSVPVQCGPTVDLADCQVSTFRRLLTMISTCASTRRPKSQIQACIYITS